MPTVQQVENLPSTLLGLVLRDVLRRPVRLLMRLDEKAPRAMATLAPRMDAVAVPSQAIAARVGGPVTVIPRGVDIEVYAPPPSRAAAQDALLLPKNSLYIGCFRTEEAEAFVALMIELCRQDRRLRGVLLTSDAPPRLVAQIRNAGLHHRIRFVTGAATLPWTQALDGYATAARDSLPARRAMACGVPVCEMEPQAIREMVEGHHDPLPPREELSIDAEHTALAALRDALLR